MNLCGEMGWIRCGQFSEPIILLIAQFDEMVISHIISIEWVLFVRSNEMRKIWRFLRAREREREKEDWYNCSQDLKQTDDIRLLFTWLLLLLLDLVCACVCIGWIMGGAMDVFATRITIRKSMINQQTVCSTRMSTMVCAHSGQCPCLTNRFDWKPKL